MTRILDGYLTEHQLATELDLSIWTVRAWRKRGFGPPWTKLGAKVLYARSTVVEFINAGIRERQTALAPRY